MLNKIKTLLNITDTSKDALLNILIARVQAQVVDFTHDSTCATTLEDLIVDMVIYNYNRQGTEGLNSENYSGVSFAYTSDYPEAILRQLRTHRKLLTL